MNDTSKEKKVNSSLLDEILAKNSFQGSIDNVINKDNNINKIPFFDDKRYDNNGYINIRITSDNMAAFITIYPPQGDGKKVTADELLIKLHDSGIIFGTDIPKIFSLVENPDGLEHLVAEGKEAENGKDAEIIFNFDVNPDIKPLESNDGKVDYHNLNIIQMVHSGEILANKKLATEGRPGQNVLGQIIKAKKGKDKALVPSKNTELIDDGSVLIASIDGQIIKTDNKVSVNPLLEIKGDVDYNTGNIEFVGPVVIKGSVQPGFQVIAEGDIEIYGNVHDAQVFSKANINVRRGIIGYNCHVEGLGNIYSFFINHAYVKAGQNVITTSEIINGRIKAGTAINVSGRNGSIKGGLYQAGEIIEAGSIGGPLAAHTRLEVGVSPNIYDEYKRLCDNFEVTQKDLKQAIQAIKYLKSKGTLDMDQQAKLVKLNRGLQGLEDVEKEIKQGKKQLEIIMKSANGTIKVRNVCNEGVTVVIGNLVHDVTNKEERVIYKKGNESIVRGFM